MALLTVHELGQTPFDITDYLAVATAGGDQFPNDERTFFIAKNGSGGAITATIAKTRDTAEMSGFGSLGVDDIVAVIPASETWVARVPVASHGDAAGRVSVTYSGVTNLTVGALRLARG